MGQRQQPDREMSAVNGHIDCHFAQAKSGHPRQFEETRQLRLQSHDILELRGQIQLHSSMMQVTLQSISMWVIRQVFRPEYLINFILGSSYHKRSPHTIL